MLASAVTLAWVLSLFLTAPLAVPADCDCVDANAAASPPAAQPGNCYALVYVPPEYKTVTEPIKARGAYEQIEVTPAQYELAVSPSPRPQTLRIDFLPKPTHSGKAGLRTKYQTVGGQTLPPPATTRTAYVTTAEYTEIQSTIKISDGKMAWRRINCDQNDGTNAAAPESDQRALAPATVNATPGIRL